MSLRRTLTELLRTTHCLNAKLCVSYNLWRLERARDDLARAFDALDRCTARATIATHQEAPPAPPASLLRIQRDHRELSPEAVAEFNRELKEAREHWRRTGRYPDSD